MAKKIDPSAGLGDGEYVSADQINQTSYPSRPSTFAERIQSDNDTGVTDNVNITLGITRCDGLKNAGCASSSKFPMLPNDREHGPLLPEDLGKGRSRE